MAYATREDVFARAGRFAGLFTVEGKRPNEADLDAFLDDVSAIIDSEIRARGYDPAVLTVELEASLRDVAAWAVLLRALPQASPSDEGTEDLLDRARTIVTDAGFPGLGGSVDVFGALAALEAGAGGGGPGTGAGSFWDDVEELEPLDEEDAVAAGPVWRRGMTL